MSGMILGALRKSKSDVAWNQGRGDRPGLCDIRESEACRLVANPEWRVERESRRSSGPRIEIEGE